jgi:hypothetical protein
MDLMPPLCFKGRVAYFVFWFERTMHSNYRNTKSGSSDEVHVKADCVFVHLRVGISLCCCIPFGAALPYTATTMGCGVLGRIVLIRLNQSSGAPGVSLFFARAACSPDMPEVFEL